MAFKTGGFSSPAALTPAAHFQTLTKRQYPDVMPHQKEILEAYAAGYENRADVALQLPTGSGKTLVGLLIADWRRIKNNERAVYLCPTKQLVRQTVLQARNQYGIDVVDLSGTKGDFPPTDVAAFKTGAQIAVSTYKGLFNTHPFFEDPDLILIDDAHAAENYIADMWSLQIEATTPLHSALTEFLRPHLDPQDHSRLSGDWVGSADSTWIEKLPTPQFRALSPQIIPIVDAFCGPGTGTPYFKWSVLRNHLDACHMYLGSREILIRPLIPPTGTHRPFANAKQRIFMSATLGEGGDLERLTGRSQIDRLAAPIGFQSAGVGRRFFIFPSLSLAGDETEALRLDMQMTAGRSVVLTPSNPQAEAHSLQVSQKLSGFEVFTATDIEENKAPFVTASKAVAILANRYDGIDFPNDECRLLNVDGLPKATNAQERFVMSKMGAISLYNERIQTRVLQAVGRCTRALQDRSTVFVTGTELVDFLTDNRKWQHLHPEVQAELAFGVQQSTNTSAADMLDNFKMFMLNNTSWAAADGMIRTQMPSFTKTPFPAMDELSAIVSNEVAYQHALWNRDFAGALNAALTVLAGLNHPELRGYRALWHYLAGAAQLSLSSAAGDANSLAANEQFRRAKAAAPAVSWMNTLARAVGESDLPGSSTSTEVLKQVEALEQQFLTLGKATNSKFEKKVAAIQEGLSNGVKFEVAQVDLGNLLGFAASNAETDGAPDPWWLGDRNGIVFEDHANGEETTVFGAVKARQAAGHPKWIKANLAGTTSLDIHAVLVTPCTKMNVGAVPHLNDVSYWRLDAFVAWSTKAISVLRELKSAFPGEGDLVWRAQAAQRLEAEMMTLDTIVSGLPMASTAMDIVG